MSSGLGVRSTAGGLLGLEKWELFLLNRLGLCGLRLRIERDVYAGLLADAGNFLQTKP